MHKLQRLTEEIRNLNSGELALLRAWFADFDGIDTGRQIGTYVGAAEPAAARAEDQGGAIDTTSDPQTSPADEHTTIAELAANMRDAYRQVAFSEYTQFVATDMQLNAWQLNAVGAGP
jgi:hypothetical protein